MNKLLLIDYNNTVIRGLKANPHLSYEGISTGGSFIFYRQLMSLLGSTKITHVAAIKDSPPYDRKKLFPQLKEKRDTTSEEAKEFFQALSQNKNDVIRILEHLNIEIIGCKGAEADDLIAEICYSLESYFDEIIILSNDSDLFQLLWLPNISFYRKNYKNDKMEFYTAENFKQEYEILPEYFIDYLTLLGSHNGVPGIKGIGHKTAVKYLNSNHGITKDEKSYKKYLDVIDKNGEHIALCEEVLPLPLKNYLEDYRYTDLSKSEWLLKEYIKKPKVNYYPLLKVLQSLGITVTEKDDRILHSL